MEHQRALTTNAGRDRAQAVDCLAGGARPFPGTLPLLQHAVSGHTMGERKSRRNVTCL